MLLSLVLLASSGGWTALSLPPLCAPEPASNEPLLLLDGVHVLMRQRGSEVDRPAPPARLGLPLVMQMLEEDARGRSTNLEFLRSAPGLLARGDDASLSTARALLADLAAQGALLDVELTCELTTGAAPSAPARARVRSGGEVFFGARRTHAFVSSFDVEVAADSGVAQPILGSAVTGQGVHVRAARVAGGTRIWIQGLLDVSELGPVVRFDPDTPDLGVVEQPSVASVQIAFSGVIESGGKLEVRFGGAKLANKDAKLVLGATTRPDATGEQPGWTVLDLAFLANEPRALVPATPGGRLARETSFAGHPTAPVSMPPSALAASLEEGRASGSQGSSANRGARSPLYWTSDLLLLPRAETRLVQEARALVQTLESARLATARVELAHEGLITASFPVCEGLTARLLAGVERPYLSDYRSELAPQTWMPAPDPELAFDGLGVELSAFGGALSCTAWRSESNPPQEVARTDAQLGKLQLLRRILWTDAARLTREDRGRTLFAPAPAGPGPLTIGFASP